MSGTALPRYLQISEALIRDVAAGRLADGARLPPERELAVTHDASVGTLRKALTRLEEMGLLERVQGSGNYIRRPPSELGIYRFFRLELLEGGGLPTAELISVARQAKAPGMPDFGQSRDAHCIRRLRRVGGVPAALEEIWLDGDVVAQIEPGALSESLYYYYREALGLSIGSIEDRVGVAPAPDWAAPPVTLEPGVPAGFVERLSQSTSGKTVEYSRTWFDSARLRYVARLR
ncbi:GntR family transcriptional regulator [Palleronia aestuarii]|uniref:GntR family transcriptional regulator n=1 Tax=Palleronia aestuarii TaxID=568105 RepID=A0A2W7N9S7_9RHOB|nr:GntR family transcriptional regulator [Palleronia aestuarii]PZX16991.1 GntR family transcriptional regulator [Palleronia aestuarii]